MKKFIYKLKSKFNCKQNLKSNGKKFAMPFYGAGLNLVSGFNWAKKLVFLGVVLGVFFGFTGNANAIDLPDIAVISTPSLNSGFLTEIAGWSAFKATIKNVGTINIDNNITNSSLYSVLKVDINNNGRDTTNWRDSDPFWGPLVAGYDNFYDNFVDVNGGKAINLAVNETRDIISGGINFPAGTHKLTICVDRYNELAESDETNNCASTIIAVKPILPPILSGSVTYDGNGDPIANLSFSFPGIPNEDNTVGIFRCEMKTGTDLSTNPIGTLLDSDGSYCSNWDYKTFNGFLVGLNNSNSISNGYLVLRQYSGSRIMVSNVVQLTTLAKIQVGLGAYPDKNDPVPRGMGYNGSLGNPLITLSLSGPSGAQTITDTALNLAPKILKKNPPGNYTLNYISGAPAGYKFYKIQSYIYKGGYGSFVISSPPSTSVQLTIPPPDIVDSVGFFVIYFVPIPTVDLKINTSDGPISVLSGSSANLSWTSTNTDSCTASNGWTGAKTLNSAGESTGVLTTSKTYTITCTGIGGTVSDSVTVNVTPPGDINVKATLDGIPWSGALFYTLGGPNGAVNHDMLVPYLFSDLVSGIYTVSYVTWGPQETIPPTTITPASSQFLPGGSAIEFVLNFTSICNDGQDNDGDGKTDYPNDKGCEGPTDPTETINLSCGGSPASPQLNQTVTWTASPSSGQTPYTYSWSGAVSGTTQSVQTSYSTTGTKTASVEVSSGTESKSTNCFVNVVSPPPPNNPPTAVAGISLDTTTFGSNISVTKGTPVTFNLSAWRGTQAAPSSKSDDPNGWTNITLGMFMLPARCEWDTDLVQNAASFAPDLARGILPTFAECSDPDNNASNYITLTKTFNDNPGTYTYYVLKMTDRASGVSSPLGTVSVTVKAQCENGIDDDGDGLIDFGGANPDPGCSSSTDNDETDVVGPPPAPPNPPGGGDPPTSPVCSASNNPDIILNWTDNSNNEDGFKIYRGTTETFTPTDPPLTTVSANTTTATDASPVIGTPYYYKITAYNSGGNSSYLTLGPVTADSCAPTFVIIDSSGDANSTIQINETEQYDGKYDSDGPGGSAPEITAARASISWSSLDTSIATINPTGAAKGKAVGSTKIKGTYSGIIAEANIIVATCSNDCSPSGQASCQGNAVITCGNYDADSCLEWSSPPVACGAGKTCVSGNCISSPAITFTASPGTIRQGESTVLSWNATNVDSCEASGGWNSDWSGNKPISSASIPLSDRTVSPKRTSDYTLTCVNNITGEQVLETKVITVIVVPIIRPK